MDTLDLLIMCWASCVGRDGATCLASDTDGGNISRRQRYEEEAVGINGAPFGARVVNPERGSPLATIEGRI